MAGIEKLKEKLALYLSSLSDSAQQLLLRSLEKSQREGSNDAASDLILMALRDVLSVDEPEIPLEQYVKREFFKDAEPFTSQIEHVNKVEARISRSSHDAIWAWIKRDIANAQQNEKMSLPCNDISDEEVAQRSASLKAELIPPIQKYLGKILKEIGGEQKIGNQLGGMKIYEDLVDILASSERLAPLKPLLARFPKEITSWSNPEGEEAYAFINRFVQQAPMRAGWAFSALTQHLSSQQLKIQLATRLAGSDDAVQVAATVYAPAVCQVMADMDAHLAGFEKGLHDHGKLPQAIKHLSAWRSLAKGMETELELPAQCPWGREIANMKTKLSETLEKEIEAAPGLIRKSLRAPKSGASENADENLLQDASRAVELFHHAERMKDSLALNGPITQIRKELDQSFEILTTSLIERSRQAIGDDIKACKIMGEAAAVFAKHLFDDSYANAFRRQLRAAGASNELRVAEA